MSLRDCCAVLGPGAGGFRRKVGKRIMLMGHRDIYIWLLLAEMYRWGLEASVDVTESVGIESRMRVFLFFEVHE